MQDKLQAQIRKILMADQLQAQDGPAMTATEVHVRVNLIRQLLGPIYARLQAEYLQPLIERCFGLAYRASERMWAAGLAGVFNPAAERNRRGPRVHGALRLAARAIAEARGSNGDGSVRGP
jgi:hypothetical protein